MLWNIKFKQKKEINFDVYCKYTLQNNEYFILKISRDSEYQESGFGNGLILETSSEYKHFLGAKCNHAVIYLDLDYLLCKSVNMNNILTL